MDRERERVLVVLSYIGGGRRRETQRCNLVRNMRGGSLFRESHYHAGLSQSDTDVEHRSDISYKKQQQTIRLYRTSSKILKNLT